MSPPHPPPPKKEVALALLERSSMFVHLDPRGESVKVPPWFKKQPQLVLQIGLNMAIPIMDLQLDEEGFSCTLSFSHSPHFCVVPWPSVFALVADDGSGRGMVWEKDMPPELVQAAAEKQKPAKPALAPASSPPSVAPASRPAELVADDSESGAKPKRAARKKAAPKEPTKPAVARKPPPVNADRLPVVMQPNPPPAPTPVRRPLGLAKKPKRELPPYLRVVK